VNALFDLSGKSALVTGAKQGLGRAIAVALAKAGADIVAVDRGPADETGEAVTLAGGASSIQADLATTDQVAEIVDVTRLGGLDVLVNNAGTVAVRRSIFGRRLEQVANVNLPPCSSSQAAGRW
jgi:2-deoxy-D-gluconate 3-dehydrogenase